ncbi:MAG: hypothetical protein IJM50_04970 [Lachnospiraceae bacterium]|nr:hypothetical protein [Lachnospiraceae bacterium]
MKRKKMNTLKKRGLSFRTILVGGLILITAAVMIVLFSPALRLELRYGLDTVVIARIPVEDCGMEFYVYEKKDIVNVTCWSRENKDWTGGRPAEKEDGGIISSYAHLTVKTDTQGHPSAAEETETAGRMPYCLVYAKAVTKELPNETLQTKYTFAEAYTVSYQGKMYHIIFARSQRHLPAIAQLFH